MSLCEDLPPLIDEASLILITSRNDPARAARTLSARMGVPIRLSSPILEKRPGPITDEVADELATELMRAHEIFLATATGHDLVRAIVEEVLILTETPDRQEWASRLTVALHAHLGVDIGTGVVSLMEHDGSVPPYDPVVDAVTREIMDNLGDDD